MPAIRLLFLLLGAAFGTLFPFVPVILAARGFAPSEIGVVTGTAALAFTIAVPAWGHLGDVVLGRRRALTLGAFAAALAMLVFGLPVPALAIGGLYVVFTLGESGSAPICDALAINEIARRARGSYGEVRLLTSAGYAVVAIAAGFAFDRTGYGPAPFAATVAFALLGATAWFAPDTSRAVLSAPARRARGGSVRAAFAVAPRLPLILAAVFLAYVGPIASLTFLPLRIQQLGGSPSDIALAAGLSALVEIPGFLLAGRLVDRIGLRALFVASAALYIIVLASYGLLDSPGLVIAVRVVSGFAWAGAAVSTVVAMALLLPRELQATGQGLLATTTTGIGGIVSGLVGGVVYQGGGPQVLFLALAGAALAGVVLGWAVLPGHVRVRVATRRADGRPSALDPPVLPAPAGSNEADAGAAATTMSADAGTEGG